MAPALRFSFLTATLAFSPAAAFFFGFTSSFFAARAGEVFLRARFGVFAGILAAIFEAAAAALVVVFAVFSAFTAFFAAFAFSASFFFTVFFCYGTGLRDFFFFSSKATDAFVGVFFVIETETFLVALPPAFFVFFELSAFIMPPWKYCIRFSG
jgi:hypothetical protein